MAKRSTTGKADKHEGDCCLAPPQWDGMLREANIERLSPSHSKDSTASVMFSDHGRDAAEETEEAVASKFLRPQLNDFHQEKPLFPSIVTPLAACIPMELSPPNGEKVPFTINRYLREYQREGIRFLYHNYMQSRGCILGDDMGLGKTVQVIGFLAAVLHKTGLWKDIENNRPQFLLSQMPSKLSKPDKVFLIVAPLSVLYNWKDELDTWGHFQCVVVHGLRKDEELARIKKRRFEVALTTYETLRLCLDQFNSIDWSAVIVDEAHKIKNPNSQITQAMKELRCHIRIGLTGTILQNNLEELWCVMDWAIPGCLGNLGHFKNRFGDPIEKCQRHTATKRALATGRKTVRALAKMISPWFLRRTKSLIKQQLPKKNDRVVYCTLTDFQRTVYQTVLDTQDVTLLLRSSEKCHCQSGRTRSNCCYKTNCDGVQMKALYFSYLAILRKVANHVALLQSTAGTSRKQERFVNAICKGVFQKFPDFVERCKEEAFEALSDPMYSGKMKVLQKLLKFYMQKRDKVLLFSLSTKLLDVLESYCMAEGLDYSRLDGTTKAKERIQIVKEFNYSSDVNICLVSTMAGGLGLNFVGANVVVLFDPTWNPANDLQAIDRAYRIGQCRDVTVLRLISLGTIEEIIYLRQVYKQQLQSSVVGKESSRRYFEAVQGDGGRKGELFGIKNLFRMQTQGICLTRKIIEREGQVEAGVMMTITHTGKEKVEEVKMKNAGEPGGSLHTDVPAPATEYKDASKIPQEVLDFSSGSEVDESEQAISRKTLEPNAVASTAGGHVASGAGRLSLLQHGFSRLLQRVGGKPEPVEGDSSLDEMDSVEDNTSEEDKNGPGKIRCQNTNRGNDDACVQKSRTTTCDISYGSDREDKGGQQTISMVEKSDDSVRNRLGVKVEANKTDEESKGNYSTEKKEPDNSKTVSKVQHYEGYSDESEDLDIAATTLPKKDAFNSCHRGIGRTKVNPNRKRHSASVRDQARYKYAEETETFTSSDDECTPAKRERSRRCHITTPQTERCKEELRRSNQQSTAVNRRSVSHPQMTKAVAFTGLKGQTSSTSQAKGVTIDSVLGGVQEVVYTHSNQRVVGGSKAEELISRAAVRDVFERKMYSQFPANYLLGTQESLSASEPDSQECPTAVKPTVVQPVTFTNKSVHHNKSSTIIIGDTPQAICRQQLEEMAAKFQFPSVHQFAEEVLRTTSTKRLEWLQQYYIPLNHPELATTVTNNFPQPHSAQTSFSTTVTASTSKTTPQTSVAKSHTRTQTPQKTLCQENSRKSLKCGQKTPRPLKKPRITKSQKKMSKTSHGNVLGPQEKILLEGDLDPLHDVLSSGSEDQKEVRYNTREEEEQKTKTCSVLSSVFRAGDAAIPEKLSRSSLKPEEAAAFKDQSDRGASVYPEFSHPSSSLSKSTSQRKEEQESSSSPVQPHSTCTLTDLIGDTSILDDLLRPKARSSPKTSSSVSANTDLAVASPPGVTLKTDSNSKNHLNSASSSSSYAPRRHQDPPSTQASKSSRKDFWDILNEGNEECINKLTDLSQVHKVCINASVAARTKSGQEDSKTLWKSNKNFLWKK